jgi:hypothetical protein
MAGVFSIQHYVIKFISDLCHVGGFLQVLRFLPPINNKCMTSKMHQYESMHCTAKIYCVEGAGDCCIAKKYGNNLAIMDRFNICLEILIPVVCTFLLGLVYV